MLVHDPLNAAKLLMPCHSIEVQGISFMLNINYSYMATKTI